MRLRVRATPARLTISSFGLFSYTWLNSTLRLANATKDRNPRTSYHTVLIFIAAEPVPVAGRLGRLKCWLCWETNLIWTLHRRFFSTGWWAAGGQQLPNALHCLLPCMDSEESVIWYLPVSSDGIWDSTHRVGDASNYAIGGKCWEYEKRCVGSTWLQVEVEEKCEEGLGCLTLSLHCLFVGR